jgi:hypothetical protein
MGDPQKPQSIKVSIRKPNRPPPPPPGLPPGFHATAAASAFITKKKPLPKPVVICCDSCYGFLLDYISVVVSTQGLATGSQGKRIRRVASQLAHALNLYFSSLVPLDIYVIENTVKLRFGIQTESLRLRGPILLTAVVNHNDRGKDLLTQMRVVLEDACIFSNEIEEDLWIGELLWDLWAQVITIHREHSKQTEPTGCGPPFGFRVHTPAPVSTPQDSSNPPPIPASAAAHAQQAWKPPDLYD